MQLYLVTCNCGQQHRVRSSQAGEQLTCQCGATVTVPTIRGLKLLKTVDDDVVAPAAAPAWQGPAFAVGLLAVFAGAILLAANSLYTPPEFSMDASHVGLSPAAIERAKIPTAELTIDQLYDEFIDLRLHGRHEASQYVQSQIDQARRNQQRRQTGGLALTGVGLLLTVVGLVPLIMKK
jgi:hypothetical protein